MLIGATTENPSFEVNAALLSRCRVYVLQPLAGGRPRGASCERALARRRARARRRAAPPSTPEALALIARLADGDARTRAQRARAARLTPIRGAARDRGGDAATRSQQKTLLYDKSGEEHYNLISALHKSLRDSDPDAALYWLARMLEAGEDPLYVARRLVRFASEDVGNADPARARA